MSSIPASLSPGPPFKSLKVSWGLCTALYSLIMQPLREMAAFNSVARVLLNTLAFHMYM